MFARGRHRAAQSDVQSSEAAGVHTLEAEDTFPGVPLLIGTYPRGAGGHAGQAVDAVPFNEVKLYQGNSIKQAVKGAQGAEEAAEKAADKHDADQDKSQPGDLVPEPETEVLPKGGLDSQEGKSAQQSSGRADELTEPWVSEA